MKRAYGDNDPEKKNFQYLKTRLPGQRHVFWEVQEQIDSEYSLLLVPESQAAKTRLKKFKNMWMVPF